jgi:hypothetical protein
MLPPLTYNFTSLGLILLELSELFRSGFLACDNHIVTSQRRNFQKADPSLAHLVPNEAPPFNEETLDGHVTYDKFAAFFPE